MFGVSGADVRNQWRWVCKFPGKPGAEGEKEFETIYVVSTPSPPGDLINKGLLFLLIDFILRLAYYKS